MQRSVGGPRFALGLRSLVAIVLGVALLWWAVPRVSGVAWSVVRAALGSITTTELVQLCLVWIAGLIAHSFVLTGALPGLTHRRALTLNLTGSAVSNVAPLGGALGVATNLHMTRSWRFSDSAFAVFTLVSNAWDIFAKLALPMVALVALLVTGQIAAPHLQLLAWSGAAALIVLLAITGVGLAYPPAGQWLAHWTQLLAHACLPARWATRVDNLEAAILEALDSTREVVVAKWPRLTLGMAGYVALQFVLFWMCVHLLGVLVAPAVVLAGFAVERLLTLAVFTPGGTGIAEAGTIATMVALGGDPLGVAAGVLLYRGFTFLIEIPVGGVWLTAWLLNRKVVAKA